mgnify:CR=1 FL=1
MKTITIEDVEKKDINQVTILDIRPEDAYCRGTVEGAINIPMQEVDNRRDEIREINQYMYFATLGSGVLIQ